MFVEEVANRASDARSIGAHGVQPPVFDRRARTSATLLSLESLEFERVLRDLPDRGVFELAERAAREGSPAAAGANFLRLEHEALRRHVLGMTPECSLAQRRYRLMIFDYDDTLAPSLTPLAPEMMEALTQLLGRGVHIGIVTKQPIGRRGLDEYTMDPLRGYCAEMEKNFGILSRLHLVPCEGLCAYRVGKDGRIAASPEYHAGIQGADWDELRNRVFEHPAVRGASVLADRGGYLSMHFNSRVEIDRAKTALEAELNGFRHPLRVVEKHAIGRDPVLHVKSSAASKALGRDYLLSAVGAELAAECGHALERSEVLVAGDKMGISPGENYDAEMFTYGAANLALGREAREGCYRGRMNTREKGMLEFLSELRRGS